MSRSKKHHPTAKQKNCKRMKRQATRVTRHATDLVNGNFYQKLSPSWNICDYRFNSSLNKFVKDGLSYMRSQFPSLTDEELIVKLIDDYERYYIRK